jgi:hypothetical protein
MSFGLRLEAENRRACVTKAEKSLPAKEKMRLSALSHALSAKRAYTEMHGFLET